MATTKCELAGLTYRLEYIKTSAVEGTFYHGTLLSPSPIEFSLLKGEDDKLTFLTPMNEPKYHQKAIMDAVSDKENAREDGDGFFS